MTSLCHRSSRRTTGNRTRQVHSEWAPRGAARFLELVNAEFFKGVRFFRVLPGFVAQWGLHGDTQVPRESSAHGPWLSCLRMQPQRPCFQVLEQWRGKQLEDETVPLMRCERGRLAPSWDGVLWLPEGVRCRNRRFRNGRSGYADDADVRQSGRQHASARVGPCTVR